MQKKTIFNKQIFQLLFILTGLLLLASFKVSGQIVLTDHTVPFKPREFYVAGVTDERTEKSGAAQLSAAVSRFIEHNLPKDQSLRPVAISIKELKIKEAVLTNGSIAGDIKLHLSFALQKEDTVDHLVDYQGGLHYTRSGDHTASTGGYLSAILTSGLNYFNDWMNKNADFNRKLAKNIKISFTDYTEKPEGDTIYYAVNRPLAWTDFQSRIKHYSSKYAAAIIPGIAYDQKMEIIKGIINVHIAMKAYVPKSACWASSNIRDDYALNHEQRHFDIVKIIAEQFKQKILAQKLRPDTFEAFINMQYLNSYRDMHAMQEAYDKETSHGTNTAAQSVWNNRIDKELQKALQAPG